MTKDLWEEIVPLLKRHWSPETVVGVMRRNGRDCVSAEWIYHFVRLDKERGGTLYTYLPHHLKHRRRPVSAHIPIKDRVSIDNTYRAAPISPLSPTITSSLFKPN